MTKNDTYVVIGGGLAGGKAVEELRVCGFDGSLVLYGEEPHSPYERPPLSKGYLNGADDFASSVLHPPKWYRDQQVDLRLSCRVTAIDTTARTVSAGGSTQKYDKLLLAVGSRPRRLPIADDSGVPLSYLRTVEDSNRIKAQLRLGSRIVIVGGGWIGLEVAAAARAAGAHVTILESLDLPLIGVLGSEVAGIFASLHTAHGVDIRTSATITSIHGSDGVAVVELLDGSCVEGDLLVIGIGASPQTSLARAAGLQTSNGIVVDEHLQTSEPDIFAAGDAVNAYHPLLDEQLRVEHWDNAFHQGVVAARNMCDWGETYDRLPYFFSDQYDLGMEYVGHVGPSGYDSAIVRRGPTADAVTAFWLRNGRVVAGMHANDWDAIDPIRQIVSAGRIPQGLHDESIPLTEVAATPT